MMYKISGILLLVFVINSCTNTQIVGSGKIEAGRDIYLPENTERLDIQLKAGNDVYFGQINNTEQIYNTSSISKNGITISSE